MRASFMIIALALSMLALLQGCVSTGACSSCIGPYDVTLSSHREALGPIHVHIDASED